MFPASAKFMTPSISLMFSPINRPFINPVWSLFTSFGSTNLQKRALRLIYFSKSREHAVPFFLKSNCLPLPSLFFRDCSYILYDINRQTASVSILNHFVKTSHIHNYRTRSVSSESFYVKFSRTDKMYAFSPESAPKFGTLFLFRLNYLNVRPFVKR